MRPASETVWWGERKGRWVTRPSSRVEDAGDGVDLGGFEGFLEAQRREDRGEALGEHGFAGAGRADHEDVVATGGGDFEGALGDVLAADVAEVGVSTRRLR